MARLLIGSTLTLTSEGSGGLTFELAPDEGLSPVFTRDTYRWPIFLLHVTAANEAALKTLVDSTVALLKAASGQDITYEETSGTPLHVMSSASYPIADCETQIDFMGLEASIAFQLQGRTLQGETGGSPPAVPGAVDEIEWQYNMVGNQLAGMTAEGLFQPTVAPATPATALENAQSWAAGLRSGSGRPSFAPAALRVMEHLFIPIQSAGGFNLVRAVVILRELPSAVASSWPSMVQDATLHIEVIDREIDTEAAGAVRASSMISVSGEVTLLTEGNTTFSNALTKASPGGVYALGVAAINALLGWFESVYGSEFPARQRVGPPTINARLEEGLILFSQVYESDTIIAWEETIVKEQSYATAFSRDFSGADWVYEPEGGPITIITRDFRIEKLGTPPVLAAIPGITKGNGWYKTGAARVVRKARRPRKNGPVRYEISGSQTYRYAQGRTGSSAADVDSIGGLTRQNVAGNNTV